MQKIDRLILFLDKVFWSSVIVWAVLDALEVRLFLLFVLGMLGIATIFFVQAFRPLEVESGSLNETYGFPELLSINIIPKVLGISSSIGTIGILFYKIQLPGYPMMLGVASTTMLVCLFLIVVLAFSGNKHIPKLFPRLIKSLIVLITSVILYYPFIV